MNIDDAQGVIFDLDDTLVTSSLDFIQMKHEIGCPANDDILSYTDSLTDEQKQKALKVIYDHEVRDAQNCKLVEGALEFVLSLTQINKPVAIVTRNCKAAALVKLKQHKIPIDYVLTREDAPAKPDPTALLIIASTWNIAPNKIAYIGDYIYDVQAAHNANMMAFLLTTVGDAPFQERLSFQPKAASSKITTLSN